MNEKVQEIEKETCRNFIRGLKMEIRVLMTHTQDLQVAGPSAIEIEKELSRLKTLNSINGKNCIICDKTDHATSDCPLIKGLKKLNSTCQICESPQHITSTCPSLKNCSVCRKGGHSAEECRFRPVRVIQGERFDVSRDPNPPRYQSYNSNQYRNQGQDNYSRQQNRFPPSRFPNNLPNSGWRNQGYNNPSQGYNNRGYQNRNYNNQGYNYRGYQDQNRGYQNNGWNNRNANGNWGDRNFSGNQNFTRPNDQNTGNRFPPPPNASNSGNSWRLPRGEAPREPRQ